MPYLKAFRDMFVALLVIPLWLASAYYRLFPATFHIQWLDDNWTWVSMFVFVHGVLALWMFNDRATDARAQQKPYKLLATSAVIIACTLFALCAGAILYSDGIAWGGALFRVGVVALPLFIFVMYGVIVYTPQHRQTQSGQQ